MSPPSNVSRGRKDGSKALRTTKKDGINQRRLTTWTTEKHEHLLCLIDHVMKQQGTKIPYEVVGSMMQPPATAGAIEQHLMKIRKSREAQQLPVYNDAVTGRKPIAPASIVAKTTTSKRGNPQRIQKKKQKRSVLRIHSPDPDNASDPDAEFGAPAPKVKPKKPPKRRKEIVKFISKQSEDEFEWSECTEDEYKGCWYRKEKQQNDDSQNEDSYADNYYLNKDTSNGYKSSVGHVGGYQPRMYQHGGAGSTDYRSPIYTDARTSTGTTSNGSNGSGGSDLHGFNNQATWSIPSTPMGRTQAGSLDTNGWNYDYPGTYATQFVPSPPIDGSCISTTPTTEWKNTPSTPTQWNSHDHGLISPPVNDPTGYHESRLQDRATFAMSQLSSASSFFDFAPGLQAHSTTGMTSPNKYSFSQCQHAAGEHENFVNGRGEVCLTGESQITSVASGAPGLPNAESLGSDLAMDSATHGGRCHELGEWSGSY